MMGSERRREGWMMLVVASQPSPGPGRGQPSTNTPSWGTASAVSVFAPSTASLGFAYHR